MPRAGWCRECGEWVWVDPEGGCQHGHGPECVDGIHESSPAPHVRSVGQGEMSPEFARFNWGAFLLPFFWGIAYGVWPVVSLWLLALVTPLILLSFAGAGGDSAIQASVIGISVVSEIVNGVIRLYIGANANRLLWTRERLRLEVVEGSVPRISVPRFLERERMWVIVGWVLMGLSMTGVAAIVFMSGATADTMREQLQVSRADAAVSIVWLAAEIALGAWLASRMRREAVASGPPDAAEDVA